MSSMQSTYAGKPPSEDDVRSEGSRLILEVRPRSVCWFWELPVRRNRISVSDTVREEVLETIVKRDEIRDSKPDMRFAQAAHIVKQLAGKLGHQTLSGKAEMRDTHLALSTYDYEAGTLEHRDWAYNIAMLHRLKEDEDFEGNGLSAAEKWEKLKVQDWKAVATWATALTSKGAELDDLEYAELWARTIPDGVKGGRWPSIVFWLLLNSPQDVPAFVSATCYNAKRPPFKMVAECLDYLNTHHRYEFGASASSLRQYHRHISLCLPPPHWPSVAPSELGIRFYLRICDPEQLKCAFSYILRWDILISTQFMLYFVDRFCQLEHFTDALDVLQQIVRSKAERPDDFDFQVAKRCSKLLTFDTVNGTDGVSGFWICRRILEMGIRPNVGMLNVVIENALRIGDHVFIWDMYEDMIQTDSIDSYTAVTVLESVTQRRHIDRTVSVLRDIHDRPDILHHPHVVSKILKVIVSFSLDPECRYFPHTDMFNEMLKYYRRIHDEQPLLDLGMNIMYDEGEHHPMTAEHQHRWPPSAHALSLMIFAYLQCEVDYNVVQEVLYRFLDFVHQGHRDIAPLAESDYVFNALLVGLLRHAHLLTDSVKLVEDMLHPPTDMALLQSQPPRPIKPVKPGVQTWTILLRGFLWHRQPQAALKIRETMKKRGMEFTRVSWNAMIRGFAYLQRSDGVAACLKMMEKENCAWDWHTEAAVGLLRDKHSFNVAWREVDRALDENTSEASGHKDQEGANREGIHDGSPVRRDWNDDAGALSGYMSEPPEPSHLSDTNFTDVNTWGDFSFTDDIPR